MPNAILTILVFSALYGISMKVADMLNEHNLKWFKFSDILFGVLWGVFASILILTNNEMANLYIAILLAFILKSKIDRINHGIGAAIMLLAFIFTLTNFTLILPLFLTVFISYTILGLIHDDSHKSKSKNIINKLFDLRFYFILVPLILAVVVKNYWFSFYSSSLFIIAYDLTKYYLSKSS